MFDEMLTALYREENDDILSDILVQGYTAYAEGIFDGTKTVFGAAKTAASTGKSIGNKLGSSDIAQGIKNACEKLIQMIGNLIKSVFNGTSKLKKLIKDIENQERKFTVQQDGKEKKVIKTVTIENLIQMGFSNGQEGDKKLAKTEAKNRGASMYAYRNRFKSIKENGSIRARMDFSTKDNAIKSLNKLARPGKGSGTGEEHGTEDFAGPILKKWKVKGDVTKTMDPNSYGRMIQELYGFGFSVGKSDGKQLKEMGAKYFKQPLVTKIDNTNGQAFEIVKGSLDYVKKAGYALIALDADAYMKAELKEIQKSKTQLEKLNRENIKGAKDAETTQEQGENGSANNNEKNADEEFFGSGQSDMSLYLIKEALKAYGEGEDDNSDSESSTQSESQSSSDNDKGANTESEQEKILKNNTQEVDKTKLAEDGSEINGIFKYIQAFLVNYAIALQKTMNHYNAFLMNLVLAGQRLLNDLHTVGKAINGAITEDQK